jgi:class 3 adenylate cyclase
MIKSLKQRLAILLILPVVLLLFFTGIAEFMYFRNALLDEWRKSAILKLERAAHQMDMRLSQPIEWMTMFHNTAGTNGQHALQKWILYRLKSMEGVSDVKLKWLGNQQENSGRPMDRFHMGDRGMMSFHHANISEVSPPSYDAQTGQETVTLISDLKDESGRLVGNLEVSVRFDYLMQDIKKYGWWQSDMACLVDEFGLYLAHSGVMEGRVQLGETKDPVELAVLKNMRKEPFGTYFAPGHPPPMVGGFFRIKQAPWVITMFAPGKKILAPIVEFSLYYAAAGVVCVVFILVLIQLVGGKMVRAIEKLTQAAELIANGNYSDPLPVTRHDELGQLKVSFNTMIEGMKERDLIRDTFGRYMDQDVARKLIKRPEASRLGGEKRKVAILMSDIREFTPISEALSPEETVRILNHYFSHMIEVIQKHKGIIVDFYGDGVLVFFDPLNDRIESTIRQAIDCGLEMQQEMECFNTEMRAANLPELQTGVGINVGEVVVGNIGSETRAKYGIVGAAVNITHRIQAEARGGEVVISDSVYGYVNNNLKVINSFPARLKGVNGKMNLYVLGNSQRPPERVACLCPSASVELETG